MAKKLTELPTKNLKEYEIHVDISESVTVSASNETEAFEKAREMLEETTWSIDDAELTLA